MRDEFRRLTWTILGGAALATVVACGTPAVVQTARQGKLKDLKGAIEEAKKEGRLDAGTVRALARAVADREMHTAGGHEATERVEAFRSCAAFLRSPLERRAEQDDAAGAIAWSLLVEKNHRSPHGLVARFADDERASRRALAALAAVEARYGSLRQRFFEDPDELVRRNALMAALEVRARGDLRPLIETARLDPNADNQSLAARAAGALDEERAVLALKDLWNGADEALRLAILDGWDGSYAHGGKGQLLRIAETTPGLLGVTAAVAVHRHGDDAAPYARAVILRGAREGSLDVRLMALGALSPTDEDATDIFVEGLKDDEPTFVVAAATRLASMKAHRKAALAALNKLESPPPKVAVRDDVQVQARSALARLGVVTVIPALLKQLKAPKAAHRRAAAEGLLSLSRPGDAALALADDDPAVRTGVVCSVLTTRQGG